MMQAIITSKYKTLRANYSDLHSRDLLREMYPNEPETVELVIDLADGIRVHDEDEQISSIPIEVVEVDPVVSSGVFKLIVASTTNDVDSILNNVKMKPGKQHFANSVKNKRSEDMIEDDIEVDDETCVEAVIVQQAKTKQVEQPAVSKAQLAYKIYSEATDRTRKVIIQRFISELGLTPNGAASYCQNCKKKFESQSE